MSYQKNTQGFTLIELMVVLVIMIATASTVLPNLAKFVQKIELNQAAEGLADAIRFGQLRALTKGKILQVRMEPTGYWLEEDRYQDNFSADKEFKPVFERVKDRQGRKRKLPQGINLAPYDTPVLLFPDGRIKVANIQICRREECLSVSQGQVMGQIEVAKLPERSNALL